MFTNQIKPLLCFLFSLKIQNDDAYCSSYFQFHPLMARRWRDKHVGIARQFEPQDAISIQTQGKTLASHSWCHGRIKERNNYISCVFSLTSDTNYLELSQTSQFKDTFFSKKNLHPIHQLLVWVLWTTINHSCQLASDLGVPTTTSNLIC